MGALDDRPLTAAVLHILLALVDGPRHGYAIMKAVDEMTGPSLSMGPGTIYGSIQRMEDAGLVEEVGPSPDGRRRLYKLTPLGRKTLKAEAKRVDRLADLLRVKGVTPKRSRA
jgi:DNA-binding PadR family transcriptional regulator